MTTTPPKRDPRIGRGWPSAFACPRCRALLGLDELLPHPVGEPTASRALDRRYCPHCSARVELSHGPWWPFVVYLVVGFVLTGTHVADGLRAAILVPGLAVALLLSYRGRHLVESPE